MEHVNEITLEEKLKSAQGREKVSSSFKTRGNCCREEIVFRLLILDFLLSFWYMGDVLNSLLTRVFCFTLSWENVLLGTVVGLKSPPIVKLVPK